MRTVACSRPPSPGGAASGSPWTPAHSGHGVAVFDLDRTLIRGSSLSRYGRELVARGLVPKGLMARHALVELTFRRRGIGTARLERVVTSLLGAAEDGGGGGGHAWVLSDLKSLLETGNRMAD